MKTINKLINIKENKNENKTTLLKTNKITCYAREVIKSDNLFSFFGAKLAPQSPNKATQLLKRLALQLFSIYGTFRVFGEFFFKPSDGVARQSFQTPPKPKGSITRGKIR